MRWPAAVLVLLVSPLAAASSRRLRAPAQSQLYEAEAYGSVMPQQWATPRFGECEPDLVATDVSRYTTAGYQLQELTAFEGPTGCIEALTQVLARPGGGQQQQGVTVAVGKDGAKGLAPLDSITLRSSAPLSGASVYTTGSEPYRCITRLELIDSAGAKLAVNASAYDGSPMTAGMVFSRPGASIAGFHALTLKEPCAVTSGRPLVFLNASVVWNQTMHDQQVAMNAEMARGAAEYAAQQAKAPPRAPMYDSWYANQHPAADSASPNGFGPGSFPERIPGFYQYYCPQSGMGANSPEGYVKAGGRLSGIQAFTSPYTGGVCIEALWQTITIPGWRQPAVMKTGAPGPLIDKALVPMGRISIPAGQKVVGVRATADHIKQCLSSIALVTDTGATYSLGAAGPKDEAVRYDGPSGDETGWLVGMKAPGYGDYCNKTSGYPLVRIEPVFVRVDPGAQAQALAETAPLAPACAYRYRQMDLKGPRLTTSDPATGKPLYASTWQDCCTLCVGRQGCQFYTWNQTSYTCALRAGPVTPIAQRGAFSGQVL